MSGTMSNRRSTRYRRTANAGSPGNANLSNLLTARARASCIERLTDLSTDRWRSRHSQIGDMLGDFAQRICDAATIADEPNFVHLYDANLSGQRPHCIMQHIEGKTLRGWIESDKRRPLPAVIRILHKITRAVAIAHERKVYYGNLKPSNILLGSNNEPYIQPMGRRDQRIPGSQGAGGTRKTITR